MALKNLTTYGDMHPPLRMQWSSRESLMRYGLDPQPFLCWEPICRRVRLSFWDPAEKSTSGSIQILPADWQPVR